jgi:hypothetical protein
VALGQCSCWRQHLGVLIATPDPARPASLQPHMPLHGVQAETSLGIALSTSTAAELSCTALQQKILC